LTDRLRGLVRLLLSIQFGVILMLFLMLVMIFATQFEATFGTGAMKRYIYGAGWFDAGVFLFVVNIVVNTWRRRPFKFRHTGFLTVHVGVLIIVTGGLMTRWFGVDGTMPIAEGAASRAIELPDNDLIVTAGGQTVAHPTEYELLPTNNDHDDLYDVPGTPYLLHVTRYYPSGAVQDTLLDDAEEENPVIRVAFSGGGAQPAGGWLVAREPARRSLASGTARVSFVEPAELDAVRARWESGSPAAAAPAGTDPHGPGAGHLRLFWYDGSQEVLHVSDAGVPIPTSRPEVTVEVQQIFRSFTLTADGHADAVDGPENPAVRFHVHGPEGDEDHFSFTAFPEFLIQPEEGEVRLLSHAEWQPDRDWLGRSGGATEVAVVREAPGRFVTWTSWGSPSDGTPLALDETRQYPERSVLLRILDAAERGRITRTVAKVSDELIRPVIKVALVERGGGQPVQAASFVRMIRGRPDVRPAAVEPSEAWIFHGEDFQFDTPEGPVQVAYHGRRIPLPFAIHLEDFREETYPGISLAASYESHVVVQPDSGEEFRTEIYMNHPLIYSGYTFYQASFQRTPGGGEITVLSVARDPGMTVSFFGFCVLVLGLILIFFVKPWFRKLDERIARSRTLAQGA
jgi:hypothetical protein